MKIFSLNIANFKIDGGALFGVVPKILWEQKYKADENNLCKLSLRSLLIDTGERIILIDNGIGNKQSKKFLSRFHISDEDSMEHLLANIGYSVDDVTDMILTHLHYDHCGGGIKLSNNKEGYESIFKNAIYWVSKTQWEWAMTPNRREAASYLEENIIPMKQSGQLQLIENDMQLYPGVSIKLFNGHTAGQMIPHINYGGKTIVFMADLIPTSTHIPLPYIASYDVMPLESLKEKESFLNEANINNYTLFFQHDYYTECCTLKKSEKGIVVNEKFDLNKWL